VIRFLLICLGGAVGTGARYALSVAAASLFGTTFPIGTLLVNVLGSFFLGAVMQLSVAGTAIGPDARLILGTGILGGFTTYSTFNYETLALLRDGAWLPALANIAATLAGCLLAGSLGVAAARALAGP
jgi:CrcB protein